MVRLVDCPYAQTILSIGASIRRITGKVRVGIALYKWDFIAVFLQRCDSEAFFQRRTFAPQTISKFFYFVVVSGLKSIDGAVRASSTS